MDWMFKVIPWFIGFVFVVIILFWIVAGILVYKGATAVGDQGVRGVVERLWCGEKATDCKLPF
jgi:hypothetical protein